MALTGYEKPLDQYTQKELAEIAKEYSMYYKTASGKGKIGGYERLTKQQLINIIKVDIDYIEANPKLPRKVKGPTYSKSKSKSLTELKESLLGVENPDELMNEILSRLSGSEVPLPPVPGRYYTYVYYAKTPKIRYDRYPLIIVDSLLPRGFRGYNFHLGKYRQYNTQDGDRLVSGLYELSRDEFSILLRIPYGKIVRN
jgi:hypothetical protein